MSASHPGPITDSPFFWVLLFGGMALVMLTAVEPKFIKRQERIERMQQSRRLAGEATAAVRADRQRAVDHPTTPRWQPSGQSSLRPLRLFLTASLAAALVVWQVRRRGAMAAYRRALVAGAERGKDV